MIWVNETRTIEVIAKSPHADGQIMADPYTIRIFVPYGNPDGLRIIDRMNWTGLGIAFPREDWPKIKQRPEFARAGIYILIGPVLTRLTTMLTMICQRFTSGKPMWFEHA